MVKYLSKGNNYGRERNITTIELIAKHEGKDGWVEGNKEYCTKYQVPIRFRKVKKERIIMKNLSKEIREQIVHYENFYDLSLEVAKEEVEKVYTKLYRFVPFGKKIVKSIVDKEYNKIMSLRTNYKKILN